MKYKTLSKHQLLRLLKEYQVCPLLDHNKLTTLSEELGLTKESIARWYNHQKWKRKKHHRK